MAIHIKFILIFRPPQKAHLNYEDLTTDFGEHTCTIYTSIGAFTMTRTQMF